MYAYVNNIPEYIHLYICLHFHTDINTYNSIHLKIILGQESYSCTRKPVLKNHEIPSIWIVTPHAIVGSLISGSRKLIYTKSLSQNTWITAPK